MTFTNDLCVAPSLPSTGYMKTSTSGEHPHSKPVVVRRADDALLESAVAVVVPDSGADVEAVERALIEQVMQQCDGVQVAAAKKLGINRNTLHKKVTEFSIVEPTGN